MTNDELVSVLKRIAAQPAADPLAGDRAREWAQAALAALPQPADADVVERVARVLRDCDPNGEDADWEEYQQDARAALAAIKQEPQS